jgi:uncharacterized membrane protein YhaH (DUF805 family)
MLQHIRTAYIKKYADFNGRASRAEFWSVYGWNFLFLFVFFAVFDLVSDSSDRYRASSFGLDDFLIGLFLVCFLAAIVPTTAVSVRRCHDIGKDGSLYLLNFCPFIGGLIFSIYMLAPSQPNENKYGPNPYAA